MLGFWVPAYYGLIFKALNSIPSSTKLIIIVIIVTIKNLNFSLHSEKVVSGEVPSYTNVSFSPYLLLYEAGFHVSHVGLKLTIYRYMT